MDLRGSVKYDPSKPSSYSMDISFPDIHFDSATQNPAIIRNNFKHKELAAGDIRVIKILPDLSQDRLLQCLVRHVRLANVHAALSYTCGTSNKMKTVVVNGEHLQVRPNLWHFLNTARTTGSHGDKELWVDAISIDQGNIPERNAQVRSMSKIYSQAADVSVWLGHEDRNIEVALDALRRLQAYIEMNDVRRPDLPKEQENLPPSPHFQTLVKLCNLPYWERMWIVQEMMLSSRIRFYYGKSCCEWRYLFSHMYHDDGLAGLRHKTKGKTLAYRLLNNRGFKTYERPRGHVTDFLRPLSDLLADFETFQCSDFHDHVFAILSMAENGSQFHIDYNDTKIKLLGRALQFCERYEEVGNILPIAISLTNVLEIDKGELRCPPNDQFEPSPSLNLAGFNYRLRFYPIAIFGSADFDLQDFRSSLATFRKQSQRVYRKADRMIEIPWSEDFTTDERGKDGLFEDFDWPKCPWLKDEWLQPHLRKSSAWETLDLSIHPQNFLHAGDLLLLEPELHLCLLARYTQDRDLTIVARVSFDEDVESLHGDMLAADLFAKPGSYHVLDFTSFLKLIGIVESKYKLWELKQRHRNRDPELKWAAEQSIGEINLAAGGSRVEPPGSINLESMWNVKHHICRYCNFDQLEPLAGQIRAIFEGSRSEV